MLRLSEHNLQISGALNNLGRKAGQQGEARQCALTRTQLRYELICARAQVEKPAEVQEIIGQKRLRDKVSGILERIEKELDSVESKIGEAMHVLDTDNDGMVRRPFQNYGFSSSKMAAL